MCGRIENHDIASEDWTVWVGVYAQAGELSQRYNTAPGTPVPVFRMGTDQPVLGDVSWGLVPCWAKSSKIRRPINARAETVVSNGYFRAPIQRRRCLVPVNGWYEWLPSTRGHKLPYYIHREDKQPFVLAGVWDRWGDGESRLDSFAIITTDAAKSLCHIHNRMPVVVQQDDCRAWLNRDAQAVDIEHVLRPTPSVGEVPIVAYKVGSEVNNARHNSPSCIWEWKA